MEIIHGEDNLTNQDSLMNNNSDPYYLNILFEYVYYGCNSRLNGIFINNAYASKCKEPGYKGSDALVTNVTITSNSDFDSLHLSGTVLNSFFEFPPYTIIQNDSNPISLDSTFIIYPNHSSIQGRDILLQLNKKPTIDSVHTFNIKVGLSDGNSLSSNSPVVLFGK